MSATPEEVESSPIRFSALDEVPDDEDDDDVDTAHAHAFGAFITTHRPQDRKGKDWPERRFVHKLDKKQTKGDELLDKLRDGDELRYVNDMDVTNWSHDALIQTIHDLTEKIQFTFYRKSITFEGKDKKIEEVYIDITFDIDSIAPDEKGGIDKWASRIKNILVSYRSETTYIHLSDPEFQGQKEVKIRHGPTQDFLIVEKGKPVMKPLKDTTDASTFNKYTYDMIDANSGSMPIQVVVAFQSASNGKFLMCKSTSKKLIFVKDDDISEHMTKIARNSPYLFIPIGSEDNERFYLRSVAYPDYYLAYDKVDLLRVEFLNPPPCATEFTETDYIRRNFTFEFI